MSADQAKTTAAQKSRPRLVPRSVWGRWLQALVMVGIPVVALVLFWDQTITRMGYGFVPAGVWVFVFVTSLRARPVRTLSRWNRWLAGLFLVAASLGVLSFFSEIRGNALPESLGGQWGKLLGGHPPYYGIPKVFGFITLAFLSLKPRSTVRVYRRLLEELGAFLWLALFGVLRGIVLATRQVRKHVQIPTLKEIAGPLVRPVGDRVKSIPSKLTLKNKVPTWDRVTAGKTPGVARQSSRLQSLKGAVARHAEDRPPVFRERVQEEGKAAAVPVGDRPTSTWVLPPQELLQKLPPQPAAEEELQEMGGRIERTLGEHGLEVKVESIRPGPRVVLFGLEPGFVKRQRNGKAEAREAARVKVDSIMAREKDLALALKTPSIRLWSPIPGEDAIGIEVPNPRPSTVSLRDIVESGIFDKVRRNGGLPVALGEGTGGEPIALDLKEMPHLLIAGATGSGKSVCINALVSSLILTKTPQELHLLMVDPKRVELTPFNGIPHLLTPVIVDVEKAVQAFGGVLNEMFRRYKAMEAVGARTIDSYNRKVPEPLPYVVIVVDELADLMMTSAYEVEQSLVRLAQLGRATGIHLVLATQRPSVNVVTGLMKANIPARIAFAVASQVDSRVILDAVGAEKLLGKGDMLFQSPSETKCVRVQGAYVSDKEIERLVLYWKSQHGPLSRFSLQTESVAYLEEALDDSPAEAVGAPDGSADPLLARAREVAASHKKLSPSVLQRRLRIGYAKALQLIDQLEQEGTIASGDPGASRPVLINSNGNRGQ